MVIERYRELFEYEIDCNEKMLQMIATVPTENHSDARYQQAVSIADHIVACRENWLDRMINNGGDQGPWYDENSDVSSLSARMDATHCAWKSYLDGLSDGGLPVDFEFAMRDGSRALWNIEGQIKQMMGHSNYHRGQVTLLVDQLGGTVQDTDYLIFVYERRDHYGKIS
ncbi:MAG: DinB family protein [Chthonomonadales bacterium]